MHPSSVVRTTKPAQNYRENHCAGIALYGSNDLCHWQLIGTSAHQYLYYQRGTPYRWHRILAIGKLQMVDNIEAVSAEYYIRRKK